MQNREAVLDKNQLYERYMFKSNMIDWKTRNIRTKTEVEPSTIFATDFYVELLSSQIK